MGDAVEKYTEGSILYIYLENFITYDKCELYPGPYMNMLMGPNGSGKSSVVAAMVIGLGWQPAVLGRSKDLAEYVKYGRDVAIVEIVLKAPTNTNFIDNIVQVENEDFICIRREISRSGQTTTDGKNKHSSEWRINNVSVSAKQVATLMNLLNVQIDNLCQFLPQDKVGEFSRMTPSELLLETQKAAAEPEIINFHQQLIHLRTKEKEISGKIEELTKRSNTLRKQNEGVEDIIQKIKERDAHVEKVKICHQKRPWLLYNSARDQFFSIKNQRDAVKEEFNDAMAVAGPLKEQLAKAKESLQEAKQGNSVNSRKSDTLKSKLNSLCGTDLSQLTNEINTQKNNLLQMREEREALEVKINEYKNIVRRLEMEAAKPLPNHCKNEDPLGDELRSVNRNSSELMREKSEINSQIERIKREAERIGREIQKCQLEIRSLDDVRVQRLEILRRFNPDVYQMHQFINENRNQFKEAIYGPICMEINVKEKELSRLVESLVSKTALMNFVVTNYEDYELFMDICEKRGWKANIVIIERVNLNELRNMLDRSMLRKLGFTCTVLDALDAPEPVLAALCDSQKIHLVPLTPNDIDHEAVEHNRYIQKYAANNLVFEIRRNRYNPNQSIVSSSFLKHALFLSQSTGEEEKNRLLSKVMEWKEQQRQNQDRMKRLLTQQNELTEREQSLLVEKEKITMERRRILHEINEHRRIRQSLELKKESLNQLLSSYNNSDYERNHAKSLEKIKALYEKHAEKTVEGVKLLLKYKESIMEMASENLMTFRYESEVFKLQNSLKALEHEHLELQNMLQEWENKLLVAKGKAKELLEAANRIEIDEETRLAFSELPETLEELDRLIALESARAESNEDASIGKTALKDYQTRKEQLADYESTKDRFNSQHVELVNQMDELEGRWLPAIQNMVNLINSNFERYFSEMGCAGEVRLRTAERNYADWALEIMVKFRDEESLQTLSAFRQSGGEKSVTTILYLLSLQTLAKSPFRVVDEINQGMDARNERKVHSLIVNTATQAARSQYFLITPKLLTGLEYHEKMHVLCVFNGEGVPAMS